MIMRFGSCYGDGNGDGASWFAYPEVKQAFPSKLDGHAVVRIQAFLQIRPTYSLGSTVPSVEIL